MSVIGVPRLRTSLSGDGTASFTLYEKKNLLDDSPPAGTTWGYGKIIKRAGICAQRSIRARRLTRLRLRWSYRQFRFRYQ